MHSHELCNTICFMFVCIFLMNMTKNHKEWATNLCFCTYLLGAHKTFYELVSFEFLPSMHYVSNSPSPFCAMTMGHTQTVRILKTSLSTTKNRVLQQMVRLPQISAPSIIEPVWDCMKRQKQPRQTLPQRDCSKLPEILSFAVLRTTQRTLTEQLFYLLSLFASSRLIYLFLFVCFLCICSFIVSIYFDYKLFIFIHGKLNSLHRNCQVFQLKVLTIWPVPGSNLFKWWWLCWVVRRHQGTHWHAAVGTAETNLW